VAANPVQAARNWAEISGDQPHVSRGARCQGLPRCRGEYLAVDDRRERARRLGNLTPPVLVLVQLDVQRVRRGPGLREARLARRRLRERDAAEDGQGALAATANPAGRGAHLRLGVLVRNGCGHGTPCLKPRAWR
jgi:hypothetical protein